MITIHVSHYMPEDHGTHVDFIAPWARAVEQAASGALRVCVHSGTSALGRLENQYAQVADGTADVAHSPAHLPPGRFPCTGVLGLPFMAPSSAEAARVLWQLHQDGALADEFADFHVLALHADSGALLHTRDGSIHHAGDLKGLRIRSPNPAVSAALACLGATPVQVAPPSIRAAVDAGALDGAVMAWDVLAYSNTADAFLHHLDAKLFFAPLYFVMNGARYRALDDAVRTAIDSVSGDALVEKFPAWWAKWEAPGAALGRAPGHHVATLDADVLARWRAAVQPAIAGVLATLPPQARAVHTKARALLDH